jgi:hypothetical protein
MEPTARVYDRGVARVYLALCVAGTILPLWFLGSFVADEGLDLGAFFDQLTGSDIALFAWADVVVSGLVVIVLAWRDRAWAALVATLAVGPSLGLPLLLLGRARRSGADRTVAEA